MLERVAVHAVPVGIGGEAEGSIGGLAARVLTCNTEFSICPLPTSAMSSTSVFSHAVSPSTARADANNDKFFIVIIDLMVIWDNSHQKNAQSYICQRQKDAGEHQKHPFEDATLKLV